RPALFSILIENPSVSMTKLSQLAAVLKAEFIDAMIASPRVRSSSQLLQEFTTNHHLTGVQNARVQALIAGTPEPIAMGENTAYNETAPPVAQSTTAEAVAAASSPSSEPTPSAESTPTAAPTPTAEPAILALQPITDQSAKTAKSDDPEADSALVAFFAEHASEIAAEADKPFQPIGGIYEELPTESEPKTAAAAAASAPAAASAIPASQP